MRRFFYLLIKLIKKFLLIDLLKGLILTSKNAITSKITIAYPEEQAPKSPRFKGLHALRRDYNGEERCIACKLCEAVCPAVAITVEATTKENGSKRASKYEIDLFKCVYCGLCEESCPVDAIVQTDISDYHFANRGEQILTKEKLLKIGDQYESQITKNKNIDIAFR